MGNQTDLGVRISEHEPWSYHLLSVISGKLLTSLRFVVLNWNMDVMIKFTGVVPRI